MNILLIHPFFLPDGGAGSTRWNDMVADWADAGHQITVLAGSIDYLTGKPYQEPTNTLGSNRYSRVQVVRVSMSRLYGQGRWGRLWSYWTFFWNGLWLGFFRIENPFDVVLASSPPLTTGLTGWLLAACRRKPLVLEVRDLWPDAPVQLGYLNNRVLRWMACRLERFLYRQAAHIVALTPAFEEHITKRRGVPVDRCCTITNGIDRRTLERALDGFDRTAFRTANGLEGRFWIVYTGAHGAANGLVALLNIAKFMSGQPVGFLLIGDGSEKETMMVKAQQGGLDNIRFEPAVPKADALRWIAAADAGLVMMQPLPVFQTMLSAKLFDYMACGKPILAAISGLTRQLIEQHRVGIYVNPLIPADWLEAVRFYIDNPGAASQHGANGQAFVRDHADRSHLAHRYLTILNRVHRSYQTPP